MITVLEETIISKMIELFPVSDIIWARIPSSIIGPSLLVTCLALVGCFSGCIKDKKRYILWILLIEYLFVVICSTVICRKEIPAVRLELVPFWTYGAISEPSLQVSPWDIVLNIALFIPIGVFIKLLYSAMPLWATLMIGLIFSCCIEVSQYVFVRGVAQFDDVMHNTIGCCIGWILAKALVRVFEK